MWYQPHYFSPPLVLSLGVKTQLVPEVIWNFIFKGTVWDGINVLEWNFLLRHIWAKTRFNNLGEQHGLRTNYSICNVVSGLWQQVFQWIPNQWNWNRDEGLLNTMMNVKFCKTSTEIHEDSQPVLNQCIQHLYLSFEPTHYGSDKHTRHYSHVGLWLFGTFVGWVNMYIHWLYTREH